MFRCCRMRVLCVFGVCPLSAPHLIGGSACELHTCMYLQADGKIAFQEIMVFLSLRDVLPQLFLYLVSISVFLCTHLPFLFLAMMSILLGFLLGQMPSRNARTQRGVALCIRGTSLLIGLWHGCDLCS